MYPESDVAADFVAALRRSLLAEGGKVGITELVDTVGRGAGEQNESASG